MPRIPILLFGLSLIVATPLFAQDAAPVLVRADRVLDVESGQLLEGRAVLVRDGRIEALVAADAPAPEGAAIIELGDMTLLPGLMDAHSHLLGDADIHGYRRLALSTPAATIKGVKNARKTLEAGFTTVRVPGGPGYADVALRDAIAAGEVVGPRLLVAGPSIGITGGHCGDNNLLPPEYKASGDGVADGPWAVRQKVRQNVKFGADFIKTCSTGGVLSKGTEVGAPQYTLEELTAMVEEAHSHSRKVAAHAHGASGIRNAILAGVDSVEHASFIDDEGIRLARERGTVLVMDIYNTEYILGEGEKVGILPESLEKERRVGGQQRANFEKAHRAGVVMAFGTDAGVYPHGDNARQFSRMVRFGMAPIQAIRAATVNTARLFGIDGETGAIKAGLRADLIAVPGNPLTDITVLEDVRFVMKQGAVFKDVR